MAFLKKDNFVPDLKKIGLSVASIFGVAVYPCLFIYFMNVKEAYFRDVLSSIFLIAGIALLIFVLLLFILRDIFKAALCTNVFSLLLLNFSFIEGKLRSIFPTLFYWHIAILLLYIFILLCLYTYYAKPHPFFKTANLILLLVFGGLTIVNGVVAVPTIIRKVTYKDGANNAVVSQETAESNKMPNIYWVIFDEYGGLDCLERYCDYDNTGFYNELQKRGFNVSEESHNESVSTIIDVPNYLNLDRVNNYSMIEAELVKQMENPYIYQLLGEHGYSLNTADYTNFIDQSSSRYKYETADMANYLDTFSAKYYILQKTAFYPFYRPNSTNEIRLLNSQFEYLQRSTQIQKNNLFTFSYFCSPHLPWIVDREGNAQKPSERENWKNPAAYIEQLRYINSKIIEMVDGILEQDKEAIIILQSDHGYRQPIHLEKLYGEPIKERQTEFEYMTSILNCVYYQGRQIDINQLSGINTLRMVFNELLDMDYDMLEDTLWIEP